jgi:hypothetical protein
MQKIILLTLLSIAISSCSLFTGKRVHGEGDVITQDRSVGGFDKVQSFGSFDITISGAETNSVKVEAEENLQQFIEVTVNENTLNIRQKKNYNINSPHGIKITISTPSIRALGLFGSGSITSTNRITSPDHLDIESSGSGNINYELKAESLNAHISGSGNITLEGTANDVETGINGSGSIIANELESKKCAIRISGSGNADFWAKDKLDVAISGSGNVRYKGNPEVNQHISGSGSVEKEN